MHNEGYRVLNQCKLLYDKHWKDVILEAAVIAIKADALLEEGLRRIEYMFHKFAEYVWGLLMELPRNMLTLIDPDAAFEKLGTLMYTFQEFAHRAQRLPMAMGFLAQGVRQVFEPVEELVPGSNRAGRDAVIRQLAEMYETFMGDQREESPEEEL